MFHLRQRQRLNQPHQSINMANKKWNDSGSYSNRGNIRTARETQTEKVYIFCQVKLNAVVCFGLSRWRWWHAQISFISLSPNHILTIVLENELIGSVGFSTNSDQLSLNYHMTTTSENDIHKWYAKAPHWNKKYNNCRWLCLHQTRNQLVSIWMWSIVQSPQQIILKKSIGQQQSASNCQISDSFKWHLWKYNEMNFVCFMHSFAASVKQQ